MDKAVIFIISKEPVFSKKIYMYLCLSARVGLDGGARETASGCEGAEESSHQVHGSVGYKLLCEDECVCVCVCVHVFVCI